MANFNMAKIILGGRITTDIELRTTPSGVSIVSFSIAVNRRGTVKQGEEQKSDFFSCVAWRGTAEFITQYFRKGSAICVFGTIENNNWVDNNGMTHYGSRVTVDEAYFVDSKADAPVGAPVGTAAVKPEASVYKSPAMADGGYTQLEPPGNDDELPF
jgi:single-strand DNA-binding protein